MVRSAFCVTLLFAGVAWGDPGITLPEKLSLQPGRLAKIEAKTEGKVVRWINPDPVNLDLIPSESGRWVIVASPKPGTYRLAAYTAVKGEPTEAAVCVVTVAGPKPPEPPDPPEPADPLTRELRALYDADTAPAELKRQCVLQLVKFYRDGVALSADTAYLNVGMFHAALKGRAPNIGSTLLALRTRMGQELAGVLGTDATAEFSSARRAATAAILTRLAGILEVLP